MMLTVGAQSYKRESTYHRQPAFPYWTLAVMITGTIQFRTEHGQATLSGPRLGLVRPRVPYHNRVSPDAPWSEQWVCFEARPGWQRWLKWPEFLPGMMTLPLNDARPRREIFEAFAELMRLSGSVLPESEAFCFNALEKILLLCNTLNPNAAHEKLDPRIRAAADHMALNFSRLLDVDSVAREVHMSPSHLAHLFSEQIGESPMRYLESQRLRRAQELLISSHAPIREIAAQVGFANPYHFSTRFQKRFGKSPREFRRNPTDR
jgi:AraC family transcriptional regulator, arabinose operon regulatory protein